MLNRPFSVREFFQANRHEDLEEEFIFMAETDHLMMRPLPNLATVKRPVAYPFAYMHDGNKRMHESLLPMVQSVCPHIKSMKQVQPIGPSPTIIHKRMLAKIIPEWWRISIELKTHEANYGDELGWILEMYAFAISAACLNIEFLLLDEFQIEPTAATPCSEGDLERHYIFHYTYPLEFAASGKPMPAYEVGYWSLNKRHYSAGYVAVLSALCSLSLSLSWTHFR